MQDRVPTVGQEGRVKITPESGTSYYAKMEMADNPSIEGTPLSKATLLSDDLLSKYFTNPTGLETPRDAFASLFSKKETLTAAVAALYGLASTATPADVLSILSNSALWDSASKQFKTVLTGEQIGKTVYTSSYVGTGYADHTVSIAANSCLVFINSALTYGNVTLARNQTKFNVARTSSGDVRLTWGTSDLQMDGKSAAYACNESGETYYVTCLVEG